MGIETSQGEQFKVNSLASVNNTLVRAGKCFVDNITLSNAGAAAAFVKLYDKATTPVAGTDVPVLTIPIPASSVINIAGAQLGIPFEVGFGLAITNLVADADTTAVAANQVKVLGCLTQM